MGSLKLVAVVLVLSLLEVARATFYPPWYVPRHGFGFGGFDPGFGGFGHGYVGYPYLGGGIGVGVGLGPFGVGGFVGLG